MRRCRFSRLGSTRASACCGKNERVFDNLPKICRRCSRFRVEATSPRTWQCTLAHLPIREILNALEVSLAGSKIHVRANHGKALVRPNRLKTRVYDSADQPPDEAEQARDPYFQFQHRSWRGQ